MRDLFRSYPSSAPESASGGFVALLVLVMGMARRLRALVIVTDADGALLAEALAPEATELDVGLGDALVGEEEPGAEDGLGEDVEDGVGDDLLVNVHVAGAVGDAPDAGESLVLGHDCDVGSGETYMG